MLDENSVPLSLNLTKLPGQAWPCCFPGNVAVMLFYCLCGLPRGEAWREEWHCVLGKNSDDLRWKTFFLIFKNI
jgi:hypothetical protein